MEETARRILRHCGLLDFFHFVGGADATGRRTHKAEVISYVLDSVTDTTAAMMVGDRSYDVDGAAVFDIPTALVTWGYGTMEEWNHARWCADTMSELKGIIRDFTTTAHHDRVHR